MLKKPNTLNKSSKPIKPEVATQAVGTPAHRQKYPARYGYNYTSKLEQAAYPKPGTAPSEIGSIKWALEESPEPIVKNPVLKKAITDAEIQKKLDKLRGPSDWDLIKQTAKTPEEVKDVKDIIRKAHKRDSTSITRDELKYLKAKDRNLDHQFINTTAKSWVHPVQEVKEEALEKMRAYAFKPTPNPDAVKGIGSFRNTIGKQLRAATSKADWERNNRRTYK